MRFKFYQPKHAKQTQVIFLFAAALFIRLPFFFRDYVDRDESTFILMGQSIADGHLPYAHLWDLKPPLLFYIFAGIETLFPQSFVAIRFFGVLVVLFSAVLLMAIADRNRINNGFILALMYVVLSSEFGSLQGVMSEHFAVLFMLLGMYLFQLQNRVQFLLAGLAFGCALLCKLSYAYAVVALLIYLLVANQKTFFTKAFIPCLLISCGVLLPFIVMAVPFILQGQLKLFIGSVFLAPLAYEHSQHLTLLQKLSATWWIVVLVVPIAALALLKAPPQNKHFLWVTIALLAGTVYTFLSSGIINGHYLVQVYPFLLLLIGSVINKIFRLRPAYVFLVVVLVSVESLQEYYRLGASYYANATVFYRPGFKVVDQLKQRGLDKEKIFFIDFHVAYWLLHQYPLTKTTTHPSNLARQYLYTFYGETRTPLQGIKFIMDTIKPKVVVSKSEGMDFFGADGVENNYFRGVIHQQFSLLYHDEKEHYFVWQRKAAPSL